MAENQFTMGVEEEFQIIDPHTRELRSFITQLLEATTELDDVELQPELHQSVVEVTTGICKNIQEVRRDIISNRLKAARIAERVGVRIGAASTHPFSRWQDQKIHDKERYNQSVEVMQDIARANLIFGLHVHIGIPDRDLAIQVFNSARYFLPHFLALSTSSPFLDGRLTGIESTRTMIFKRLPRTGIPERFFSYREYEDFVATLVRTGCIDDARRIWWDLRPHPFFQTLEFRVCDLPSLVEDSVAIAALVQAVVAKLVWLQERNLSFNMYRLEMLSENKWRAARYGVHGKLIDWGRNEEVPFAELIEEILEFVDDVVDDLGSRKELEGIRRIAETGTSADRQRDIYEKTGNILDVVDLILEETMRGVSPEAAEEARLAAAAVS
ncbi:MAG: carboxylate-amine ligase [Myxococcota bacterium]|jgi:carboxylate-amine ligase